jgi:hypothetical protein
LHSSSTNISDPTKNSLDETNPNLLQLRIAHMMANMAAAASSSSTGHNNGPNVDSMMNTFANMQRNFLLKILSDPMAAAQAAQATAAVVSATQNKSNISPISLITSNNKQLGSGRKRKSTPEKRVVTNHRSTNNNDDVKKFLFLFKKKQISHFSSFRHLQLLNMNQ